jgi:DNA-binding GntR family transcriptional regulator
MSAARLDRQSAWELVAFHIKGLIFDGELLRGARVPQDEIAADLGISRIPVREALIALERDAWVRIIPHRGAFVVGFDDVSIADHYEVLGLVYGLIARRAADRATPESIDELARLQRVLQKCSDPAEVLDANNRFLAELRRFGGSPRISATLRSMSGIVPGNFFAVVPKSSAIQRSGTGATVRALRQRDGDAAAEAMLELLRRQGKAVLALLTERGVVA